MHTIPNPFATSIRGRVLHDLRDLLGHLRAVTAVHGTCRARRPRALGLRVRLPRGHRRLAFLWKPAGTRLPGERRGKKPNLIGVLESDSTQPARSPPAPNFLPGTKAPSRIRRHGQHATIIPPARPRPPPVHRRSRPQTGVPAGQPGRSSATLEPVTAPAGARAAHLSPATPARDHPQPPRRPSFAGTPRRQDPVTFLAQASSTRSLPGGRGGDERRGGGVVQRAGQPVGDAVQPGDGVIGEQRLLPPGQGEVVAQVGG